MKPLTFWVPWDNMCSDNRKYISRHFVLSPQYRSAKTAVGLLAKAAARKQKWGLQSGRLELAVVVTEPDHRVRDLNWSKFLKDGITEAGLVWVDDSQVRIERWESLAIDKGKAGAEVTVSVL